ncbi:ABC transporter iron(III)/siderophore permease protein [Streptomyces bingchenggensis BCW-1]|uniref:ABC transporter iron(III)/siderophore permease protein n=2 Tax=Streptomyces TaxID=1883 RepID=D7BYR4_STRBB|nr:ABC transporter iron(III)/siderophore permease protein [Streptomyces bingchenggensis BCW-1]
MTRRPVTRHPRKAATAAVLLAMTALLALAMMVAISIGAVNVPLGDVWRIVLGRLLGGQAAAGDLALDQIVWNFRTPRVVLAALVGTGLAVSGVVLQAVVANPLADPYVLGVSSGASLGAVLAFTLAGGALGGLGVSSAAFLGAVAAMALVFVLGRRAGRLAPTRLVLAGVAVGYVLLAATSYLQLRATPAELRAVMFWTLGSVAGARWDQLPVVATVVLTTTAALALLAGRLNALLAGDESATALGVDVHRLRAVLLVLASLLTGTVIAVAGGIGFVGLMIPHLVRLAFGADHRRLLPLAAVTGALYMVLVDLLSRTLTRPNELPLGILTALFGAPFFLWLLRRNTTLD